MMPSCFTKNHIVRKNKERRAGIRLRLEMLEDRITPSAGALDPTFGTSGLVITAIGASDDFGHSMVIDSAGKIVSAGKSYNGGNYDFALARYNADGSLDVTFDGDGKLTTAIGAGDDLALSVIIDGSGKIVVAGYSFNGSNDDFALTRYNVDGSLDTTFG